MWQAGRVAITSRPIRFAAAFEIGVPTLLVSGRHDEATPALQETLQSGIRDAEWILFEDSSHMPHLEERERYMHVVGDWLARHDRR